MLWFGLRGRSGLELGHADVAGAEGSALRERGIARVQRQRREGIRAPVIVLLSIEKGKYNNINCCAIALIPY